MSKLGDLWGALKAWEGKAWGFRFWLVWSALIVLLVAAVIPLVLQVWPYNDLRIGPPGPLVTDEYTEEGVPVIRAGGLIRYESEFCNDGVNVRVERWLDLYGPYANVDGDVIFEGDRDDRTAAFKLPEVEFYPPGPTCATTLVSARLPLYVPTGVVVRFRIINRYFPNPLRTVEVTNETEEFLLLGVDEPVP